MELQAKTVTRRQFADRVGRTTRQVDRWIRDGQIRVRRFGRWVSIPLAELEEVLRQMGRLGPEEFLDPETLERREP